MARKSKRAGPGRRRAKKRSRRARGSALRTVSGLGQRAIGLLRAVPAGIRLLVVAVAVLVAWVTANGIYQVVRKPTELYFPVSGALAKTPAETWRRYAPIFRAHSTPVITPEFLAALAQVEGSGNPLARTYWRWSLSADPFEVYRPASSAVGMYQITDTTFDIAKRYCIHDHAVVEDGPWHEWRTCWFNAFYTRVVPTHAVELTAALLDRQVDEILGRRRISGATLEQKQDLAAVIHLCGRSAGEAYAGQGFQVSDGRHCGDHRVRGYLARVRAMKRRFAEMANPEIRSPRS